MQRAADGYHRYMPPVGTTLEELAEASETPPERLIERRARARGVERSQVLTGQAQYVDLEGTVWLGARPDGKGGRYAGHITPARSGWAGWGLEAAGPPWSPPRGGSRRPVS